MSVAQSVGRDFTVGMCEKPGGGPAAVSEEGGNGGYAYEDVGSG
eukprot:CAMPEP_0206215478 /NCGR_PEP_ID=MMETSP0047_2-20121206/2216_1 /ASSEMBLY_ACC=CAM_ASM_000192 /TAXON_ID=195065 /ORGANISM="Chroomonas mesostigmatica_cf, Strain CCMP1168" /LENGTH=43 /DNA_ID= /DNA_START= /DNA_END= /DNA_ORIENTATION=